LPRTRLRVVIDTNIVISAYAFQSVNARMVIACVMDDHVCLVSGQLTDEWFEAISRPKFNFAPLDTKRAMVGVLTTLAESVPVTTTTTICRDPKDNYLLALALDGQADVIVTGDSDLLVLGPYHGTLHSRISA
jgi:uncharacterized protein